MCYEQIRSLCKEEPGKQTNKTKQNNDEKNDKIITKLNATDQTQQKESLLLTRKLTKKCFYKPFLIILLI